MDSGAKNGNQILPPDSLKIVQKWIFLPQKWIYSLSPRNLKVGGKSAKSVRWVVPPPRRWYGLEDQTSQCKNYCSKVAVIFKGSFLSNQILPGELRTFGGWKFRMVQSSIFSHESSICELWIGNELWKCESSDKELLVNNNFFSSFAQFFSHLFKVRKSAQSPPPFCL